MYGNIDLGNLFKEINQESITIALQKDNGRKGSGVFTEITGTQEGNDLFALTAQIENELTDIDKGTQLLANSIIAANKEMFNTKESQQLSYNIIASEAYALGIVCADVSSEDFMDKVKELKNNTIALIERIVRWIKNKISEISDNISVWVSTARANTGSKVKKLKEYKEKINKLSSPVPSIVSFEKDILSDISLILFFIHLTIRSIKAIVLFFNSFTLSIKSSEETSAHTIPNA
jgi:DNA-directed RNA polymerase beta' subunit